VSIKEYHSLLKRGDLSGALKMLEVIMDRWSQDYTETPMFLGQELERLRRRMNAEGGLIPNVKSSTGMRACFITPAWNGDLRTAEMQATWLARLGHSFSDHIYLYRGEEPPAFSRLPNLERLITSKEYPKFCERPHPAGPNICFRHAVKVALSKGYSHFYWLEPDCIPAKRGWAEPLLELARQHPGEAICGVPGGVGWSRQWKNHFAGNSLYNVSKLAPLNWDEFLEKHLDKSFDIWLAQELGYIKIQDVATDPAEDGIIWGANRHRYSLCRRPLAVSSCGYDHWRPEKFQTKEKTFAQCLSRNFHFYHSIKDSAIYQKLWTLEPPHFSVLVFSYNLAAFLPQCLDSLIGQTLDSARFEVILLDDGSTDETVAIARDYSEKFKSKGVKFRFIQFDHGDNCPNFNQQRLLQEGLKHSRGTHVCLLDADDLFSSDKLEHCNRVSAPDVILIQHPADIVDADGRKTGVLQNFGSRRFIQLGDYTEAQNAAIYQPTSFLVFERMFLEHVLQFVRPDIYSNTWLDVRLTRLAPFYGKVVCSQKTLGFYRVHAGGDSLGKLPVRRRMQEHHLWFRSTLLSLLPLPDKPAWQEFGKEFIRSCREKDADPMPILQDPHLARHLAERFPIAKPGELADLAGIWRRILKKQQIALISAAGSWQTTRMGTAAVGGCKDMFASSVFQEVAGNGASASASGPNLAVLYLDLADPELVPRIYSIKRLLSSASIIAPIGIFNGLLEHFSLSELASLIPLSNLSYVTAGMRSDDFFAEILADCSKVKR
jgi:glycosyltransferase involved in cell wall biosynthesis